MAYAPDRGEEDEEGRTGLPCKEGEDLQVYTNNKNVAKHEIVMNVS